MPDLVIKDSDSCWKFNGGTFCNVGVKDKKSGRETPVTFIVNGDIKKVKQIHSCWKDEDGNLMCSVKTKGKDGGKRVTARVLFNQHLHPSPSCDPKKDPFCPVRE